VCGTLLEQGRGNDPTSPEGQRIADLVRTSNEVRSVLHARTVRTPRLYMRSGSSIQHIATNQIECTC